MQYAFVSAAIVALASSVFAQTAGFDAITAPTKDLNATAGDSLDIVWQPGAQTGTVTLSLLQGATPDTLQSGGVVASGIDNTLGTYTWAIPASTGQYATYGIQITLDSNTSIFQYSFPFHIVGAAGTSISSSASATGTTTVKVSLGTGYTSSSAPATSTTNSTTTAPAITATASSTTASSSSSSSNFTIATTGGTIPFSTIQTTVTSKASGSGSTATGAVTPESSSAAGVNAAAGAVAMIGGVVALVFAL
ncbi:hypothetical protein B7494_g1181 [Chlorociboria aeruginascens]|nr:hypothetical protein B7494_g1181 [Chlorociboria aeruginascens]